MSQRVPDNDHADLLDQKLSVACPGDDHKGATGMPAAGLVTGHIVWPAVESDQLLLRRSFVQDMASQNAPRRPYW